ncbi:MAG: type II toxin-antitoxin system RelE/ParE family toxin [archaeon]|nr:type II toxin-antitoxin system RelE/ParE family toxin [Candidatus Micrarchaeota archaeon]
MEYELEIRKHVEKVFEKIAKKDPLQERTVKNKIKQIMETPYWFKPLRKPMQGKRRVHTFGPFVLIYSINEKEKTIIIEDYDHHDKIYR